MTYASDSHSIIRSMMAGVVAGCQLAPAKSIAISSLAPATWVARSMLQGGSWPGAGHQSTLGLRPGEGGRQRVAGETVVGPYLSQT